MACGGIKKKVVCLVAGIFLLNGCLPGILVTGKAPTAEGQAVHFRLGNQVEVNDWVSLQKQVCRDLDYATETLPADVRQNIYKYSCVEYDHLALGNTLSKLQPGQIDEFCKRLSQKGYIIKKDEILTPAGEIGVALLVIIAILSPALI